MVNENSNTFTNVCGCLVNGSQALICDPSKFGDLSDPWPSSCLSTRNNNNHNQVSVWCCHLSSESAAWAISFLTSCVTFQCSCRGCAKSHNDCIRGSFLRRSSSLHHTHQRRHIFTNESKNKHTNSIKCLVLNNVMHSQNLVLTSSAVAEWPRDASRHWPFC